MIITLLDVTEQVVHGKGLLTLLLDQRWDGEEGTNFALFQEEAIS